MRTPLLDSEAMGVVGNTSKCLLAPGVTSRFGKINFSIQALAIDRLRIGVE